MSGGLESILGGILLTLELGGLRQGRGSFT